MTLDVAARLAAGRSSVTNTQTYVTACHAVGYQHPDLTAHAAQIMEWFGGEDGLNLTVLDADCAVLRAASAAADEAVRVSRDGLTALTAAWDGESGSLAVEFVDRHCAAGLALAGALRAAAETCEALRDGLGRLVDEKVAAAVSIDDRRAGERPVWLAAAATVSGGSAERTEAVEVVTQQITPYVDTDIRTDWLTAMRSATSSVGAAYEDALRQLNAAATVYFEVPGALGSPPPSPGPVPVPVPVPAQATSAAAAPVSSPASVPILPPPVAVPEPTVPPPAVDAPPAVDTAPVQPLPPALGTPASAGMPALPSMPDVGGGPSGLIGQIADAIGGLIDSMPDDTADDDLPEPEDPVDEDDSDEAAVTGEPASEDVPATEDPSPEEVVTEELPTPDAEVTEAEPPPPLPPPEPVTAPVPPAPAAEHTDEETPCEIAADELPQVGQ
ncbi:hypothetical protein [Mycolicibacterium sp. P1-5]|uniref:hypothetical protein n=1 Tax=Mycolicibacterium sp. P1-5 TaxID=2024617 RepID=UPI0011F02123|nr:hypothetical protein [Mycolicibacterium sp. P1-5]KAA0110078.1 hypothetical protein CIW47_07665 [Mycolicibacterium sp. P1-5]